VFILIRYSYSYLNICIYVNVCMNRCPRPPKHAAGNATTLAHALFLCQ
jgi:hypothetical protein